MARVMEVLMNLSAMAWLEGYLPPASRFSPATKLRSLVDSMFISNAMLKVTRCIRWRRPIASLNYLLPRTSGDQNKTASRIRPPVIATS